MYNLSDTSLEWSLLHLTNYYDSDFFPRLFEFDAIKRDWTNVKKHIAEIDLEKYAPKSPIISLAPKANGTFRVIHQLDPIDSIIYAALLFENAMLIESYRIPEIRKIACSYRIKPDTTGSFFLKDTNGYPDFMEKAADLTAKYPSGVVLICDIVDFYNQIYLHRVNNILSEAGSKANQVIESFLGGLNTNISRGIPVGPAPSILIAEAIMGDINRKILNYTDSFAQYVDDLFIFFESEYDAKIFLHELTRYLYSIHRLVLSPDKTQIKTVSHFKKFFLKEEARLEKEAIHEKLEELDEGYALLDAITEFEELDGAKKFEIRSETYPMLFYEALKYGKIELGLMRHILRQAGKYKVKSIIPQIFSEFDKLLPVIREIVIYFEKVLNEKTVIHYEKEFSQLLCNPFIKIAYVNMWIFTLFQNKYFNAITLKINYNQIIRVREKALIARRENNLTYIKDIKDGLDTLGNWDRRAVLYSSHILSEDEAKHWLGLESSKGDILNKAICSMIISDKKSSRK
ncbi:RNA-directed DNA polymerase [Mucilaginibacter sp. CSA2-8R]|uniref:RNA-directed DNA polymerase n=1 Tax=Mucilaginibacter sp. CSA2-8R TaxID=3141542 RepID=UPI00315D75CC